MKTHTHKQNLSWCLWPSFFVIQIELKKSQRKLDKKVANKRNITGRQKKNGNKWEAKEQFLFFILRSQLLVQLGKCDGRGFCSSGFKSSKPSFPPPQLPLTPRGSLCAIHNAFQLHPFWICTSLIAFKRCHSFRTTLSHVSPLLKLNLVLLLMLVSNQRWIFDLRWLVGTCLSFGGRPWHGFTFVVVN